MIFEFIPEVVNNHLQLNQWRASRTVASKSNGSANRTRLQKGFGLIAHLLPLNYCVISRQLGGQNYEKELLWAKITKTNLRANVLHRAD